MKVESHQGVEDILVAEGLLTEEQAAAIKFDVVNTARASEEIITQRELVTPEQLVKARAKLLNIPYIKVSGLSVPVEVLDLIPEPLARKHKLVPFQKEGILLHVAMVDPLDLQVIEFLEKSVGLKLQPFMGVEEDIQRAIDDQYRKSIGTEVSAALEEAGVPTKLEEQLEDIGRAAEVLRDAPVARIVSALLEYAVKSRASDIHVEPIEGRTRVRYRIDGILQERLVIPKEVHPSVVSRIKILADLKIDEHRVPQDGRFRIEVAQERVDLRVSTLPSVFGEKVVIRLLKAEGEAMSLSELGLQGMALKTFERALEQPNGMILVTGPTGSGKTVTLAAALTKISTPEVNVITLEDPVEIQIPNANQVQVHEQAGLTFANGLRAFVRQDPDIIMVGEIRDAETAELAVHAALTGHLVFSTLHTNSASAAPHRLLDMGVEAFLLISTLDTILAQRLVRRVCPQCREEYEAPGEVQEDMKKALGPLYAQRLQDLGRDPEGKPVLSRGKGCNKCEQDGYIGRVGIFEVLPVDSEIAGLIIGRRPAEELEGAAIKKGMITLLQDGYLKVLEGLTTVEEVLRVSREAG